MSGGFVLHAFLSKSCEVKSRILDLELLMGSEAPVMMLSDVDLLLLLVSHLFSKKAEM